MKDRVSAKPNRYAVYDDAHNFLRYEYHERADEPTQVGDPLNKANLLPDTVATSLGLTGNPQVKDALLSLNTLSSTKAKIETGSYTGTDVFGASDKNSLTFSFQPKVVMIHDGSSGALGAFPYIWGCPDFVVVYGTNSKVAAPTTVSGNTMSWYSTSAQRQYNLSDTTYNYVAIG